ncbi:MAG TPA: polysaccharide deacetylase family protein [Elusimicrobiota bacterium]|nr:polysaccharide deacetylase family protein [Elusimicrobiota bacterium]
MAYLPILTYHRILRHPGDRIVDPHRIAVSREQFDRHCAWFRRIGLRTIPLAEYVSILRSGRPLPPRRLAITFDDGYEDVGTYGMPILAKYGFTATLFAVPGDLGGTNQWDDSSAPLMNADQLRAWQRAGHEIGAHSMHHAHLTRLSGEQAFNEMSDSKKALEDALGKPVPLLAYPYGETNNMVGRLAQEAGFEAAFATDHAPRDHAANPYWLRRAVVFPRNSIWEMFCKTRRWYPRYQDWKRRHR